MGFTKTRATFLSAIAIATVAVLVGGSAGGSLVSAKTANVPADNNCFWLGPISTNVRSAPPERFDGRLFNFPEESATYWIARYRLQPGQHLELKGTYAKARYESLNSYAVGGTPVFSLPDTSIAPDQGSKNPFRTNARRDLPRSKRRWTVDVLDQQPPTGAGLPRTMYAPSTESFASELVLRVYEADKGLDMTGGAGLPRPTVVNEDGSRVAGTESVCAAANDPDRTIDSTVQRIPPSLWTGLTQTAGPTADPATSPALNPPQWERFFNTTFASRIFQQAAGNPRDTVTNAVDTGGFYSNRDSRYVLTHLSRKFGRQVIIRGTMPTFPQTYHGKTRMDSAQVRFWSLCSGESRVTTRTPDCLADRQVPLGKKRKYTIVVSTSDDRTSNSTRKCGIGWLNFGENGDGAGRRDYSLLLLRNMLPSPDFKQAIANITKFGDEASVMGRYFPRTTYATSRQVKQLGC